MPTNTANQAPMGQRIRAALTTPPAFPADIPRLQTKPMRGTKPRR